MGFASAGIAPAEPTGRRAEILAWLDAGKHGNMSYMREMLDERLDVRRLLPGARSLIMVADRYAAPGGGNEACGQDVTSEESAVPAPEPSGLIARYARGRDYHSVIRRRLHDLSDRLSRMNPGARMRTFVDTGPVLEREHAARAEMGGAFVGKHTLLIHPRLGSYLLLGGIATTLKLAPGGTTGNAAQAPGSDHCGSCTRCIDACPTRAITPHSVDARRCVSYLTLEHRGIVDESLHAGIGLHVIGCDICQEVCPFNQPHGGGDAERGSVNPVYSDHDRPGSRLPLLEVLGWSEADRSARLSGSAAKRASLEMLRRSAVIASGNAVRQHRNSALESRVIAIAEDETEQSVVRETARQVVEAWSRDGVLGP